MNGQWPGEVPDDYASNIIAEEGEVPADRDECILLTSGLFPPLVPRNDYQFPFIQGLSFRSFIPKYTLESP